MTQDEFNTLIGELDHMLSRMMMARDEAPSLGEINRRTLKHHAEDMIGAGEAILAVLGLGNVPIPVEPVAAKRAPKVGDRVVATRHGQPVTGILVMIDPADCDDPDPIPFAVFPDGLSAADTFGADSPILWCREVRTAEVAP